MVSPHPVGHSATGSTSIVRRQMLWNTPDSDVKVNSAPLLILKSDNIVKNFRKPLRVGLQQHSLHRIADQPIHMYSGEGRDVVPTIGIVALGRAMHREFPLRRGDGDE